MESKQKQLDNSDKEMQATSKASTPQAQADAFSKYSNDAIRLKTILLKGDTFDLHEFAGRNYTSTVQKMNLSIVNTSKASNPQDDVVSQICKCLAWAWCQRRDRYNTQTHSKLFFWSSICLRFKMFTSVSQ